MSLKGKTALSSALFFAAVMSASALLAAEKPAKLENIAGSELKRVILTPKAAERLAIQTGEVREEPVNRWLSVEGQVEAVSPEEQKTASLGSQPGATVSDAPPVQVRVPKLDPTRLVGQAVPVMTVGRDDDEDDDDDDDDDDRKSSAQGGTVVGALALQPKPADAGTGAPAEQGPTVLVVPIGTGHKVSRLRATLAKLAADGGGPNGAQYYIVDKGHNLQPGQHVHVRLPQAGSGAPQPVIPYSSVIYDYKGGAWTYTTPEPLTFVRHRIEVEYVDGNKAILKEGPPVGTKIVTAGAAELMGVETKFGH